MGRFKVLDGRRATQVEEVLAHADVPSTVPFTSRDVSQRTLDYPGFVHTMLVDMRARLRSSQDPNRIFTTVLDVARAAGLVAATARARR